MFNSLQKTHRIVRQRNNVLLINYKLINVGSTGNNLSGGGGEILFYYVTTTVLSYFPPLLIKRVL